MTTIEQAFFEAVLADIAYVDGFTPGLTDDLLTKKIQDRISGSYFGNSIFNWQLFYPQHMACLPLSV